jgi:hypothetical protein
VMSMSTEFHPARVLDQSRCTNLKHFFYYLISYESSFAPQVGYIHNVRQAECEIWWSFKRVSRQSECGNSPPAISESTDVLQVLLYV